MVDLDAPDGDHFPGWQNAHGYMVRAPGRRSQAMRRNISSSYHLEEELFGFRVNNLEYLD